MRELPGVDWVGTAEMEYLFPTARDASTFDRYLGRIAQIPYTRMGFAIIGTMAARHLHRFVTPPRKAIVVDCDNTLWSGLCGETAVADLRVGSGRRALQEFLIRQQEAGRLLLIASKNDEANVFAVFDRHPEMLLKREHLTAWRIDWNEKPRNVRDLANELGLGLDSFILIDDDRFECEAMRSAWPEVLTLRLPEDENETGAFLRGVWEFDFRPPTTDDRRRRDYYVQNVERNRRRRGMSLADFVKTLELRLDIAPLAPDGLARAAQLTERINQFNLNGIRRSEGELRLRLADAGQISLLLKAQDRFGDYGDIGLILASVRSRSLLLETLVLSCRALGKGIEESIASRLAQLADDVGASRIEFLHRATDRNGPFRNFLSEIGVTAVGDQWTVSPDVIRRRAVESSAPVAS